MHHRIVDPRISMHEAQGMIADLNLRFLLIMVASRWPTHAITISI